MKYLFQAAWFILLLCVTACKPSARIPLTISPIFSNHMVLQQNKSVAIWGKYSPGQEIKIMGSWGAEEKSKANEQGNWKMNISTPAAGGPYEVQITTTDSIITIKDVLVGEVWLASGQSNMAMPLTGFLPNEPIDNYEEEIANADYPKLREFRIPRSLSAVPETDYMGEWMVTTPETAASRSATAYFFARKLFQELNIPIGIIHSSWGGTPVESWMSREKLLALGEFEAELAAIEEDKIMLYKEWFAKFPAVPMPANAEQWATLRLEDDAYAKIDFNDENWSQCSLTDLFEDLEGPGTDGAIWFRKNFEIQDTDKDFVLEISEGIDDQDITYFNGQVIGNTLCYNCPRSYRIPKSLLKKGTNSLAIRVIDTGGPGGVSGQITLSSDKEVEIDLEKGWKYKYIAGIGSGNFLLFHRDQELANNPPEGIDDYSLNSGTPSVLFNAMINPIIPYNIKGAIWYQGESNVGRHDQYLKLFPAMISEWRDKWGYEFPFYFVQIAPFGYGNSGLSPALRDAQRKSLTTPKTGMAITMDIGHETSIHPGNKQDVGDRLARLALSNDYSKTIVSSGPLYKGHSIEGNKIIISFDHADGGLSSKSNNLDGFEIAGSDGVFKAARAEINGHNIVVSNPAIKAPLQVRYGWKDYLEPSLFNSEGLPASSFSSE